MLFRLRGDARRERWLRTGASRASNQEREKERMNERGKRGRRRRRRREGEETRRTIGMLIRFARFLGFFVLFCECRSSADDLVECVARLVAASSTPEAKGTLAGSSKRIPSFPRSFTTRKERSARWILFLLPLPALPVKIS